MQYLSDYAQLFYAEQGDGVPVVLLHPTPVDHRFWNPIAAQLASHYRVILPDLRGHGQSEAGSQKQSLSIEQLGVDLERLLDTLKIRQAIFAGCSIGGYLLYELWRRCPERILALAFCSSKPGADTEANRAARERTIAMLREQGRKPFIESTIKSLIGEATQRNHPEKIAEARSMMLAMPSETLIAVQQGLAARPDSLETARTIAVPTCVVAAEQDSGSTPALMRELASLIVSNGTRAEYHEIPNAGHYAPWEQPEVVGPLLLSFFRSVAV